MQGLKLKQLHVAACYVASGFVYKTVGQRDWYLLKSDRRRQFARPAWSCSDTYTFHLQTPRVNRICSPAVFHANQVVVRDVLQWFRCSNRSEMMACDSRRRMF